jgi:hypothetical protein
MIDPLFPTPKQISTYLISKGWREQIPLLPAGVMFALADGNSSEKPITVFLPESETAIDYPLRVSDVVETLTAVEDRSRKAVLADILAEKWDATTSGALRPTSDEPSTESVSGTGKP